MAKKQLLDLSGLTYYTDKIQSWVVANSVQSVDVGSGLTKTGSDEQHPVISLSLADYTFLSASTSVTGDTADRTYAVGLDSNGKLAVNVPWDGGSGGNNKMPLTSITPTQTTTIDPYIMYNLGTVSSAITIVFNTSAEVAGYCAEYLIKFVAGNDCSITLPSGTKYNGGSAPTYVSGRYYEINICNGLAVVGEFY